MPLKAIVDQPAKKKGFVNFGILMVFFWVESRQRTGAYGSQMSLPQTSEPKGERPSSS